MIQYDAIIFDLFGTLVNKVSFQEYKQMLLQIASILSLPYESFSSLWNETSNQRAIGVFKTTEESIRHICKALQVTVDEDKIKKVVQLRLNITRKALKPKVDAIETLFKLKKRGFKIGLISNCSAEVPILWENTPFTKTIDVALFSSFVGLKKPDPRIYRLACEQLDVKPQNCLYIGDGDSNELTGASQVGMCPVLIRDPHEKDLYYIDEDEWNGQKISTLKEVFNIL